MSRNVSSHSRYALVLGAVVVGLSLMVPAAAHSQTANAERALLNRVGAASARGVPVTAASAPVTGEWALLARSAASWPKGDGASRPFAATPVAMPIKAEHALLGRQVKASDR